MSDRGAEAIDVVTVFVIRDGRVLLLRRSDRVGTYRGRWAGVSGYLERERADEQAWIELGEELGIGPEHAVIEAAGEPLEVTDGELGRRWRVHPFRVRLAPRGEPRLDWEHTELRWVEPREIGDDDTVPGLRDAWVRVRD